MECVTLIERFSIECSETKTKATTVANQKKGNTFKSQWEFKVNKRWPPKARENAGHKVVIGDSFAVDWLRELRKNNAILYSFWHSIKICSDTQV